MTEKNFPAVSIIVPMYNVEKYIGECLDSILAQTFADYELLVVDDCSTDKSCEIVESYIPKFNGRLQLTKSEKNSGGRPGIPRNIAIELAQGEYIMFVDSDDAITPTALEELYPIAKRFDADLLVTQRYYEVDGDTLPKNGIPLTITSEGWDESEFVKEPTLMSDSLMERAEYCGLKKLFPVTWDKLFRREFLEKNNLRYPNYGIGEDLFFGMCALFLAKNVVISPSVYYIWRKRFNSISRLDLPPEKLFFRWTESTFIGMPLLNKFMDRFEIFREHSEYKYLCFEVFVYYNLYNVFPFYENAPKTNVGGFVPSAQADKIIRPLLDEVEDKTTLLAVFFNRMNFFQMQRHNLIKKVNEQKEKIELLQKQLQQLQS